MLNSESTKDIKDLVDEQKKEFEKASLCHNQTGRWLRKLSGWFQIITGISALFILGKDTIEWTKISEKTGGQQALLILSTVLNIVIEVIVVITRVKDPAKKSELHFQKSSKLDEMQKIINHRRIKCHTYDDYNSLYIEIEEKSSKLPIIHIPEWAKKTVTYQLKNGQDSVQMMQERRRRLTLKRSGVKLSKHDKLIYRGMENMSARGLREIANSCTVQKIDSNRDRDQSIMLMSHKELLDYLKCTIGIRSSNLSEKHRNNILRRVNVRLMENHILKPDRITPRQRNITDNQYNKNISHIRNISRASAVSDILSEMSEIEYEASGMGPEGVNNNPSPPDYVENDRLVVLGDSILQTVSVNRVDNIRD
jgi:hypothetical protein